MKKVKALKDAQDKLQEAARLFSSIDQFNIANDVWNAFLKSKNISHSSLEGNSYFSIEENNND